MKRRIALSLALACIFALAGCGETGNSERTGGVLMGEYSGIVTDRFTEGGGSDTADVLAVDTGNGETMHFTIIESTQFIGAEDVSVGDEVDIRCEEYTNSSYRPILSVKITEVSPPETADQQEITGTVARLGAGAFQTAQDLSVEDAEVIADLLATGNWLDALTDCADDCVLTINAEALNYHSDCGTFNDLRNERSLHLTEAQRETVNQILKTYIILGSDVLIVEEG